MSNLKENQHLRLLSIVYFCNDGKYKLYYVDWSWNCDQKEKQISTQLALERKRVKEIFEFDLKSVSFRRSETMALLYFIQV